MTIAMLLLIAKLAWASTPPPDGYVDASTYGYNTTDATSALQAALDTGSNVFVPKMEADWIIRPITAMYSNQKILLESGVELAAKAGSFLGANDSLLTIHDCTNVSLTGYGSKLTMRKDDYTQPPYEQAQWRHAIKLTGMSDITIEGLTINETGGDGIYVGRGGPGYCENVTIKNVVIKGAYRNGISVISVKNLMVDNAVIVNTNGQAPQAGIDFEPNYYDEIIENITIRNSIINANGYRGILFAMTGAATGTIENVTIVGNSGPGIQMVHAPQPGVTFKDLLIANNSLAGVAGISTEDGEASGMPRDTITYSNFGNNTGGDTSGWVELGTGTVTVMPTFYSTDINDRYYMYLDPSVSSSIAYGASDGQYMGARGIVPEANSIMQVLSGFLLFLGYRLFTYAVIW